MAEEGEFEITAETLFEILRREKDREELQQLPKKFYAEVVRYLNEKKASMSTGTLFSEQEREILQIQIHSIKQIIKELYNRREKKILDSALIKARTNSAVVDTSAMLPEEKELFEKISSEIASGRQNILLRVLEGNASEIKPDENEKEKEREDEQKPGTKMVRFLEAVPQFYGDDAEIYGPFAEDDIARLPESVANLLIEKERAEEIVEGEK